MANYRILVYSNPLVVDKIGKTFQFWKDSGFIYTKRLIEKLPADWRFYWCIPDKIKADELTWFKEANQNIELIPYPYSTGIHQNRYNFSVNTLSKYFTYGHDIDAVFNNQPEVSSNLAVWFSNQRREVPPIFSFYHWIDCEESRAFGTELSGYNVRQFDGARDSEKIMFHNLYAFDLFMKEARSLFKEDVVRQVERKYMHFHPPATLFQPKAFEHSAFDSGKKIIVFNHRLNNTTCWQEVLHVCDALYKVRQDFILWFTDDSKLRELNDLKSRPYVVVQNLRDGEYGYLLRKAHFSICNHKGYSTWNMAVIDSFLNECLALTPDREVYKEMFKYSLDAFGREFSHNGDLKEKIVQLLDNPIGKNKKLAKDITICDDITFQFDDASAVKSVLSYLLIPTKQPAKYEKVLDYINSNGVAPKKDWVNEFWSFHVNSNFPMIRRNLLADPTIIDDTTQATTVYRKINKTAP